MKHGIMSAFEELQRRLNDRRCNRDKFAKDVCEAWCALYQALGGTITGSGYSHAQWGILPNATRCIGLIVAARSFSEKLRPFPSSNIYVNGKDGEHTAEYKAYMDQPLGASNELWDAAADACEESVA